MPIARFTSGQTIYADTDPSGYQTLNAVVDAINGGTTALQTFNVTYYGAKCDGVTDDTAAVNACIAAVVALGGGYVLFPAGTCLMTGAMVIPYTGTNSPKQVPLRLIGAGASPDSYLGNSIHGNVEPTGGTILDLRYSGGTANKLAKIDTRGSGLLELSYMTIKDGGTGNYRFIRTTNTTLHIHHVVFCGNAANSGTACVQDCIQLGGNIADNTTVLDTNADTAGFQGYGTLIGPQVFFRHMRRCIEIGSAGNAITVRGVNADFTCGSSSNPDGPIVLYGNGYQTWGNDIEAPILELNHYKYGAVLYTPSGGGGSNYNVLRLGTYDESASTAGVVYFDANSTYNRVELLATDSSLELTALGGAGAAGNVLIPLARAAQFPVLTVAGAGSFGGAVGIGNANPQQRLDVGDGAGAEIVRVSGGGSGTGAGAAIWLYNGAAIAGAFGNKVVYDGGAYSAVMQLISVNQLDLRSGSVVGLSLNSGNLKVGSVGGGIGFYGVAGGSKPTITGSRGANAALASLLTELAGLGLIVDSTS